ncbi:MAG: cell division protein SepF [Candidatus Bathyarchaeota archaeon]|nr:cell division protein SepF [Candidatus Termiticorpusculum sp.]
MPSFGLFNKQKKQDPQEQTAKDVPKVPFEQTEKTTKETQIEEQTSKETQQTLLIENPPIMDVSSSPETTLVEPTELEPPNLIDAVCKTYLKAIPLRDLSDLVDIKTEIQNGNILILRITPLASKSVESVKNAVNELYSFTESIGGDIARLGEERVVICPKNIRIWREKTPSKNKALSATATTVA